jgi:ABC-type sugar transport system permease subunit/ABC-type glycerol-3-phosphate transport system substrate-binding protein
MVTRRSLAQALRLALCLLCLALPAGAKARGDRTDDGRIRLEYWDKWSGFEAEAMRAVVNDFNASQKRIFVDFVSVSGIVQKTLIATAGGNPPDIAGVWAPDVVDYADKRAVVPLDDMARGTLVSRDHFLPIYFDMGVYEGTLYGVPSTPGTTALHYNKRLFREAGLDPERPPKTLAELDDYAKKLTKRRGNRIEQVGFLFSEPPWWPFFWVHFTGGELWDGGERVLADMPENVRAFEWIERYARLYGVEAIDSLTASFGNFGSAQNPFMSEKLAMVFQGVWMANYIEQYAPKLEWAATPFPVEHLGDPPVVFVDTDMLVIPKGARHPEASFEFIAFVARQSSMEKLVMGQRKNSPLREQSARFFAEHKHPQIRLFQELALSPRAHGYPRMSIWPEYRKEMEHAFQRVWLLEATPKQALADVQARMQPAWDRARARRAIPPSPGLDWVPFVVVGLLVAALVAIGRREARKLRASQSARSVRRSLGVGLAFVSPWAIGLFAFLAYPLAASLVYGLTDYSTLSPPRFVGLENFSELARDEVFWVTLKNTLIYAALSVPLGLLAAFTLALMLDARVRGSGIYRTLVFLPSLTPVVATAVVWLWIYNARYGILNHFLERASFGLIDPIRWLVEPKTALPSIILMSIWSVGQTVVILLAAMQDVPTAIYEAAELDGAGFFRKVRHITLPLVSPVLYFNAIMSLIVALQLFTQPFIMTEGGPARATLTYAMRVYQNAFLYLRMGYASAMAWILFLLTLGLTLLAVRAARSRVHYTA